MSRCFPFPPPGYEKKISTDDEAADSLIKEKQKKEKKHKKDKEKKEGKEKKDRETSKDKQKDRKEKKEKHKDKKKDKDRDKEKSRTSSENRKAVVVGVLQNTGDKEKVVTNTVLNNGNGESKFVQDLARRIRDEEEATDRQSVRKISLPNGVRENNNPISQNNHRKIDEKRSCSMERRSENAVLRGSSNTDHKGSEFMAKPSEKKDQGKKTEIQEKNHRKESVTKSDKPLDSEGVKKNEPKYTANKKIEEKKEEKTEAIGHDNPKYREGGPRLKDIDVVDTRNFRAHDDLSKASSKNLTVLGKRKDLETNGFLYENGSRPNKIQRPAAASPITSVENGRKLGACQTLPKPVSELQGPPVCNPEVKEHRINGFIDSQKPKNRPTTSSSVKVKENREASSKKRPHPDLKYLDQILNVPQREELHEVDEYEEQEWLFGQSGMRLLKKPKSDSTTSLDESLQVWNQALRIESADILALPYVVPL